MDDIRLIQPREIDALPTVVEQLPNTSRNRNGYHAFLLSFCRSFQNLQPQDQEAVLEPWRQLMGADDGNDSNDDIPGFLDFLNRPHNRLAWVRAAAAILRNYSIAIKAAWSV